MIHGRTMFRYSDSLRHVQTSPSSARQVVVNFSYLKMSHFIALRLFSFPISNFLDGNFLSFVFFLTVRAKYAVLFCLYSVVFLICFCLLPTVSDFEKCLFCLIKKKKQIFKQNQNEINFQEQCSHKSLDACEAEPFLNVHDQPCVTYYPSACTYYSSFFLNQTCWEQHLLKQKLLSNGRLVDCASLKIQPRQ